MTFCEVVGDSPLQAWLLAAALLLLWFADFVLTSDCALGGAASVSVTRVTSKVRLGLIFSSIVFHSGRVQPVRR